MEAKEFNHNVTEISPLLQSFALNLTRDTEEAKDLLQETIYKVMANQDKFIEGTNLKAWMYTIMRNLYINEFRRKKKFTLYSIQKDGNALSHDKSGIVFNDGESNIDISAIRNKINKINNIYKVPFMMHFNGYKYSEIADYLGLALGTVKSRIYFSKQLLQKELLKSL